VRLQSVEIDNYRSLEHVEIRKFGPINALIGRNNSGKSAVMDTLALLGKVMNGQGGIETTVLTKHAIDRAIEISLTFEVEREERENFIIQLCTNSGVDYRAQEFIDSPLIRQIEYLFKSIPGNPSIINLIETKMMVQDGRNCQIQRVTGETNAQNPASNFLLLKQFLERSPNLRLDNGSLGHGNLNEASGVLRFSSSELRNLTGPDEISAWPLRSVGQYFAHSFFFSPFRHGSAEGPAVPFVRLNPDGSNLPSVIHAILSNNTDLFSSIEEFMQGALPDVGMLQSPLIGDNRVRVGFRLPYGNYLIPIIDMGGGVEQLLMVAVVLLTTGRESTLFMEEPETHLHAGAQRFLLEKLLAEDRQIFMTTHSPTFLNANREVQVFQVSRVGGSSSVRQITDADSLGVMLADIGARNSDLLLSDAVLFVEGPSDRDVISDWSVKVGQSLGQHNVSVLPMGGGDQPERGLPVRSGVLAGISQRSPVPHIFLVDRDERSYAEIERLEKLLGERVHILAARELENYLLNPRALMAALGFKYHDSSNVLSALEAVSTDFVESLIDRTIDSLYGLVLLKRIRSEIGGVAGGLLRKGSLYGMLAEAEKPTLAKSISREIKAHVDETIRRAEITRIVKLEQEKLRDEWSDAPRRFQFAPGEEIIAEVFRYFGGEYKKPDDAVKIAREMRADEIPSEITGLIARCVALTQ
jgi:predicted ATPase